MAYIQMYPRLIAIWRIFSSSLESLKYYNLGRPDQFLNYGILISTLTFFCIWARINYHRVFNDLMRHYCNGGHKRISQLDTIDHFKNQWMLATIN